MTDFESMLPSYYDMQCTGASVDPIVDIRFVFSLIFLSLTMINFIASSCTRMRTAVPRCEKAMRESCTDTFDALGCEAAAMFCTAELELPFFATGFNPYDISKQCEGELSDTLCYPITKYVFQLFACLLSLFFYSMWN